MCTRGFDTISTKSTVHHLYRGGAVCLFVVFIFILLFFEELVPSLVGPVISNGIIIEALSKLWSQFVSSFLSVFLSFTIADVVALLVLCENEFARKKKGEKKVSHLLACHEIAWRGGWVGGGGVVKKCTNYTFKNCGHPAQNECNTWPVTLEMALDFHTLRASRREVVDRLFPSHTVCGRAWRNNIWSPAKRKINGKTTCALVFVYFFRDQTILTKETSS